MMNKPELKKGLTVSLLIALVCCIVSAFISISFSRNLFVNFSGDLKYVDNLNECPYTDIEGEVYEIPITISNNTSCQMYINLEMCKFDEFYVLYSPPVKNRDSYYPHSERKNTMFFVFDKGVGYSDAKKLIEKYEYRYSFRAKYSVIAGNKRIIKNNIKSS